MMSHQHPIEKVKADVKDIKMQLSLLQEFYSARFAALEEAVGDLWEERAPSPPPVEGAGAVAVASRIPKSEGVDKNLSGTTQLHLAAESGNLEEVSSLLWMKGADSTLRDEYGNTPLHLAAYKGHVLVCASLLASGGVDIKAKNNNLWTPLHYASFWGRVEVVKLLLERGADATLRDNEGKSPIDLARNVETHRLFR